MWMWMVIRLSAMPAGLGSGSMSGYSGKVELILAVVNSIYSGWRLGVGDCQCIKLLIHSGFGPYRLTGSDFSYTGEDVVVIKTSKIYQIYIRGYLGTPGVAETMAVDELLILHGFDFGVPGPSGITALMCCFRQFYYQDYQATRMMLLLERGVDTEVAEDSTGYTALHNAVESRTVWAFKLPVQYGARLDARTSQGEKILHIAASNAEGLSIAQTLSQADVSGLDLDARNIDGNTAHDLLRERAQQKLLWDEWRFRLWVNGRCIFVHSTEDHIAAIRALETFFHNIQDHQGVPIQERCPALRIAAEHDDDDIDEDDSIEEPVGALPGAWPE